ncbi:MAG: TonB-dependent receptor [Magnetococcales bacterium]|nr:TonB-dependent receptor [Magnetococcales bacterium]
MSSIVKISAKKNRFRFTFPLCACSWIVSVATAQAAEALPTIEDVPVVVTATRTPVKSRSSLAPVTVMTRTDMEAAQTDSLPDLLRGQPGIDVVQNGGPGSPASLYMRGTNSGHVLVLVNGRKMGSATLGLVSWQNLPVSQIERIEVVRGPRSTLYGSEAIGGVVQIFTRERSAGLNVDAEVGYGSWNSRQGSLTLSGGSQQTNGTVSVAALESDGYNAKGISTAFGAANDLDDDGFRSLSFSGRIGHTFSGGATLEADLFRSESKSEYDATSIFDTSNIIYSNQQSLGLTLTDQLFPWWRVSVAAGLSRDDTDNYTDSTADSFFDTHRTTVMVQNDLKINADHLLTFGLDYMNEGISASSSYTVSDRDDWAIFSQYQGRHEKSDWVMGVRGIHNEQFGAFYTGDLELGYQLDDSLRFLASYGTAFKAPTFNDLYFPVTAFGGGNPALEPEESESLELGLVGRHQSVDWSLRGFRTDINGLINWEPAAGNPFFWAPVNVGSARISGLEVEAQRGFGPVDLSTALTLLEPENLSSGKRLNRRSTTTVNLGVGYHFQTLPAQVQGTLLYQSGRYDDAANTVRVPGYGLLGLTASYDLDEAWQIRLKGENLLGREYQTTMATSTPYHAPGRNIFLSLVWRYSE